MSVGTEEFDVKKESSGFLEELSRILEGLQEVESRK